jgi:hypothetical protein
MSNSSNQKRCESHKNLLKKENGGKKSKFSSNSKKKNKQERNSNNKQTVDDLHHVACFDLQTALPTAAGDISNCNYNSKHFTYNCTVCDLQMEGVGDVY